MIFHFVRIIRDGFMKTVFFALMLFAIPALAAGPDFSLLLDSIDFDTTMFAIFAIAAVLSVPAILILGVRSVLRAVKLHF